MSALKERLTEILIKNKLITQEHLEQALEIQKKKGGRLSDIITELNFVKEKDLSSALSQGLEMPLIDLKRFKIDADVAKILPADIAQHYQIIPISKFADTLTLAMADPLNIFAIDDVEFLTGYKINPIIAPLNDILQTISIAYPDMTSKIIDDLVKEINAPAIEILKESLEALPAEKDLQLLIQEAPIIKLTNLILEEAVKAKASDVLIEPQEKKLRVRLRIDGLVQEKEFYSKKIHPSVISRIKVISNLNIAEHRLPQDGRFKANILKKEIDFRVSVVPSSLGESIAIRILDPTIGVLDIEKLGFSKQALEGIKKMLSLPHGMVIVCGPTGSGKTTTLYAMLNFINSPTKNIVTVEDPIEYQLRGINQVNVRPYVGLTFATSLRSILRQDPDIIMIGEIRDFSTVDIAIKSALTGHLVISTLHTTTSPAAVTRLINMGVEPYLINASIIGVVAQRLLRKICPLCKEKVSLEKEVLEKYPEILQNNQELTFFKGRGCKECFNTGYSGRLGIAEILVMDNRIRELVLKQASESEIKKEARKQGMRTLRQEGLRLVLAGETTLEEVLRLTVADE